jgi:hypothetical protein
MSDPANRRPQQTLPRIPVKLHKQVSLIRTVDPILAEELQARKTLARMVAGRLSDTVLLVRPEEEDAILDELRRMGHTPRVVR